MPRIGVAAGSLSRTPAIVTIAALLNPSVATPQVCADPASSRRGSVLASSENSAHPIDRLAGVCRPFTLLACKAGTRRVGSGVCLKSPQRPVSGAVLRATGEVRGTDGSEAAGGRIAIPGTGIQGSSTESEAEQRHRGVNDANGSPGGAILRKRGARLPTLQVWSQQKGGTLGYSLEARGRNGPNLPVAPDKPRCREVFYSLGWTP